MSTGTATSRWCSLPSCPTQPSYQRATASQLVVAAGFSFWLVCLLRLPLNLIRSRAPGALFTFALQTKNHNPRPIHEPESYGYMRQSAVLPRQPSNRRSGVLYVAAGALPLICAQASHHADSCLYSGRCSTLPRYVVYHHISV